MPKTPLVPALGNELREEPVNQTETIAFLSDPKSYGMPVGETVAHMQTHISHVFLLDERAFKLKRSVRYPYVDYATAAIRLTACERELAFNRATAPNLYLGVRRITRGADGGLEFDGDGALVDAVVEMVRFKQADLFDRMAEENRLPATMMDPLANEIAEFHAKVEPVHAGGGAQNIAGVLDINLAGFGTSSVFDADRVKALDTRMRARLTEHAALLDAREEAGRIGRCHGDLHLRNICLFAGQPLIFDCIEFNDQIATIDTAYDLAFVLMDLWYLGLKGHANRLLNRYFDKSGDEEALVLLPFLMAVRAQVRAHVSATLAQQDEQNDHASQLAEDYFALAEALLTPAEPPFVAIGGFSGSGKSTVAALAAPHLGPPPGARILESDRVRKAQFGVAPDTRLPQSAYERDVTRLVYHQLSERAVQLAQKGCPVLADAVFSHPKRRDELEELAAASGLELQRFWLDVPAEVLRARVSARSTGPSDATLDVLERQLSKNIGALNWTLIPAQDGPQAVAARLVELVGKKLG